MIKNTLFYLLIFTTLHLIQPPIAYSQFNEDLQKNNLYPAFKNGLLGYIDSLGNEIIPFKYDQASKFSSGFCAVEADGKFGYVDESGKEVIELKYDFAKDFHFETAIVYKGQQALLIDKSENLIKALNFERVFPVEDEPYYKIRSVDKKHYGLLNQEGVFLVDTVYKGCTINKEQIILASDDKQQSIINTKGETLIPFGSYNNFSFFTDQFIKAYHTEYNSFDLIDRKTLKKLNHSSDFKIDRHLN
jgi:hypothetical protein